MLQRTLEYNRQDRAWLTSTNVEGRNDIRPEMPPDPEPSRFSEWSSLGSPPARTSPHSAPDIQVEQNENTQNQLNMPPAVETRPERVRTNPSEEVDISPQMDQQREDQSVPAVVGPAPLNIEVGTQRNDVESKEENENNIPPSQVSRSVRPSLHVDDLMLSRNVPWESSNISNPSRSSQIRTQDINIREISSIPQVERGISSNDRQMVTGNIGNMQYHLHEGVNPPRTSISHSRDSPDDSSDDSRSHRGRGYPNERGRPPEREMYSNSDRGRPQGEKGYPVMEDPQIDMEEDHLLEEDCLVEEDPLMMEDHQMEMEDPQDTQIEEDPQDLEDLLDQ